MAYGTVKVDNITFDNGGSDQNVTVSGLYRATTSGVTVSGTIAATTVSGVTVIGSTTVSGATVTGTTANFTSGNFSNIISSAATMSGALIMANQQQVRFREAVGNGVNHIALQAPAIVSADQTITLPDQTGTVITTGDNGSVSSTMLATNLTISAAAGSAAAPSIAFTGDPNTGIYSPGADQLAVATNGTGRLFVDATGNINLAWGVPRIATIFDNDFRQGLQFNTAGRILNLFSTSSDNGGAIAFSTRLGVGSSDTDYGTERLRIDSSGNVGIGTISPQSRLDLGAGTTAASQISWHDNSTTSFGNIWQSYNGARTTIANGLKGSTTAFNGFESSTSNLWGRAAAELDYGIIKFYTDAASTVAYGTAITPTERLRIDSSGNVGIGTSSPSTTLHVVGTSLFNGTQSALFNSTTGSYITFQHNGTSVGDIGTANQVLSGAATATADFALSPRSTGSLILATNTAERLRIDSSGNVGIGTSSPSAKLHVYGGDLKVQKGVNADDISELTFSNLYRTGRILSSYTNPAYVTETYIAFHTNRTGEANDTVGEAMRIAGGNVGIGTTSPTTLLDVNADTVRVRTARTPASAAATGATGEICWDASYIYVCTATNTWKRSAISTW
jgi:hypothetical protein